MYTHTHAYIIYYILYTAACKLQYLCRPAARAQYANYYYYHCTRVNAIARTYVVVHTHTTAAISMSTSARKALVILYIYHYNRKRAHRTYYTSNTPPSVRVCCTRARIKKVKKIRKYCKRFMCVADSQCDIYTIVVIAAIL